MRVIGGQLRGRKLHPFKEAGIRPTSDRIRESIFNILGPQIRCQTVLDLFAGTGALGIEALSRGAAHAVFIEQSRRASILIQRNLEKCGMVDRARIVRWDATRNLRCLEAESERFDGVFMDPPYDRQLLRPALIHLANGRFLIDGAWVVAEHSSREPMEEIPLQLRIRQQRRYGKTLVTFFDYVL